MTNSEIILKFFAHECIRCGFCCTVVPCRPGLQLGSPKESKCKFLEIGEEKASCMLMLWKPEVMKGMGAGVGCCMSAKMMDERTGDIYDFASLPKKLKRATAVANYETQGATGIGKWGRPFKPGQPHHDKENKKKESKTLTV